MTTYYPLEGREDERRIVVVVPIDDGLRFVSRDITTDFHGRDDCLAAIRACAVASDADGGAWVRKRLRISTSEAKPALFAMHPYTELLEKTGFSGWEASRRHGRFTRLRYRISERHSTTISLMPSSPFGPSAFFDFLGWGARYGMMAGGLGSMGQQLWRSTLPFCAVMNGYRSPESQDMLGEVATRDAYYGARKEAPFPTTHKDATYWDMTSAYPAAMGASPFGVGMKEVKINRRKKFPDDVQGIAIARVSADPPSPWSPVPARVTKHAYMFGHFREQLGAWTLRDLACARDRGDYVYVEKMWLPTQETAMMFGPEWLSRVREARELPAPMRWWAKRALNACWGTFAIDPAAVEQVTWADTSGLHPIVYNHPVSNTPVDTPLGDTLYVAAEVTARCRQRLWTDCLQSGGALYVDTDGVILSAGYTPKREGATLGEWTAREHMSHVEIRAPGVYRFRRADDKGHSWHYVTSGVPANREAQRWLFEQHSAGVIYGTQAYGGDQVVLPPGDLALALDNEHGQAHARA